MGWGCLIAAGALEIAWAISLQKTDGFQNWGWLGVNVAIGLLGSVALGMAVKSIPLGVAYPIWKGLAIIGIILWDGLYGAKGVSLAQIGFSILILGGIVGMKVTS